MVEPVSNIPTFRQLPGKRSAYVARINETDAGAGMSLRIRFTNKTDYGPAIALGEITLNDFAETFETPLTLWSAERYERQWREGVDRLRLGLSRSCLITSLIEPGPELFGICWKLYHEGEQDRRSKPVASGIRVRQLQSRQSLRLDP